MKNMRIVIYYHDIAEAQFYEALCRELGEQHDIPIELKVYDSTGELLLDLDDPAFCKRLDVIYFALTKDNVEIPHLIRDAGYTNLIVFIGEEGMIMTYEELFDIETYNFVQSDRAPAHLERFSQIFQRAGAAVAKAHAEKLVLSFGGEMRQIDIGEIHYFEVQQYLLSVHYGDGQQFSFVSSLSKMEHHLRGRGFMRTSRFYLISLRAVQSLTVNSALMCDGAEIPIGRRYYQELKHALDNKADWA